jgi:hypothetical protein
LYKIFLFELQSETFRIIIKTNPKRFGFVKNREPEEILWL